MFLRGAQHSLRLCSVGNKIQTTNVYDPRNRLAAWAYLQQEAPDWQSGLFPGRGTGASGVALHEIVPLGGPDRRANAVEGGSLTRNNVLGA